MAGKRQNYWLLQKQQFNVLQQCQIEVNFQRKGSSIVLKGLQNPFKELAVLPIRKRAVSTF